MADPLEFVNFKLKHFKTGTDLLLEEKLEPDILIGADLMPKLTTDHSVTLKCGLKAIKTVFGWTIIGPIPQIYQSCLP